MLKKAIAMSLEEKTGARFTKGENRADEHNNFQAARSHRLLLRMMRWRRRGSFSSKAKVQVTMNCPNFNHHKKFSLVRY